VRRRSLLCTSSIRPLTDRRVPARMRQAPHPGASAVRGELVSAPLRGAVASRRPEARSDLDRVARSDGKARRHSELDRLRVIARTTCVIVRSRPAPCSRIAAGESRCSCFSASTTRRMRPRIHGRQALRARSRSSRARRGSLLSRRRGSHYGCTRRTCRPRSTDRGLMTARPVCAGSDVLEAGGTALAQRGLAVSRRHVLELANRERSTRSSSAPPKTGRGRWARCRA